MRSVNKVILIGNLTRDPTTKETAQGRKIVTFTLATNREWMTTEGSKKSLAEFHNIAAWGKLAEICEQFLKKGKLIYIEGYLKTRYWESTEGNRVSRTEIVAYDMIMLNKRGDFDDQDHVTYENDAYIPDDDSFNPEFEDDSSIENVSNKSANEGKEENHANEKK